MNSASATLLARILSEGAIDGQVIKVDRFLNHQVDPALLELLGAELAGRFAARGIAKVLTAETSGIMVAQVIAGRLGVPFVYAKKKRPRTMGAFYSADSYSFTKQESTTLYVSREVLGAGERVLFVDDFFASGSTFQAIEAILAQAGAVLAGTAVIIDKAGRSDVESILTLEQLRREA